MSRASATGMNLGLGRKRNCSWTQEKLAEAQRPGRLTEVSLQQPPSEK